jgi:hypothetical protein
MGREGKEEGRGHRKTSRSNSLAADCRKKIEKYVRMMYFSFLLPLLLTIRPTYSANIPSGPYILPQGTGPYLSRYTAYPLTDQHRPDPWNSTHSRRLMISRFDPVSPHNCKKKELMPYMPPKTASLENEILAVYDFPKILQDFVLEVCTGTKQKEKQRFPLAIFSPGLNTTRLFGSSLAQELASYGFTVLTIDHPYDVDITEFPDGEIIFGGRVEKPTNGNTSSVDRAVGIRAQDVSFLLDTLDKEETEGGVAMFGQSFGGPATAESMLLDSRIRTGVNLDGSMFGRSLTTPLSPVPKAPGGRKNKDKRSFLLWGSTDHNTTSPSYDPSWPRFWATNANTSLYMKEITITPSVHGSSWDLHLLVDVVPGLRESLSEIALSLVGPAEPSAVRVWEIMGRYISAFFWHGLGLKREDALFKGESGEFPEVKILRG